MQVSRRCGGIEQQLRSAAAARAWGCSIPLKGLQAAWAAAAAAAVNEPRLPRLLTWDARSPAVIAISSLDRKTGCFNYWEDFMDVKQIVEGWRKEWG